MSTGLLDVNTPNQPFSLPNATVEVLLGGATVKIDVVEWNHTAQSIALNLGDKGQEAVNVIPLLQKKLDERFSVECSYSEAWYVFNLCSEAVTACKKKFDQELKLLLTTLE